MSEGKKPWWFPTLTDDAWLARIRSDYPDSTQGMSDDALREKYADGRKYATTWDHTGDAYDQFEHVADALAAERAAREAAEQRAAAALEALARLVDAQNGSPLLGGSAERFWMEAMGKALAVLSAQQSEERKG